MDEQRQLNVLFLPAWYPNSDNPVLGIFTKEHAKAASLLNNVTVICTETATDRAKRLYETVSDISEDGIRTIRIKRRSFRSSKIGFIIDLWAVFVAVRTLLRSGWQPDVIHAHIFSAGAGAVLLGKLCGVPVVVTEQFTGFPLRRVKGLGRLMAKFAFENASLVCPVSEDLKNSIQSYGIRANFKVVANVVDTKLFFPIAANPDNDAKAEKKRMLFVALLNPKKGVPYLIAAIRNLKAKRNDFVLDIIGDGPNRFEYETQVHQLGLSDNVRFHGIKTKVEVATFMQHCDFFVLPSLVETFGVVFIEALACGKPVVGPDIGGPNEIVTSDVGILVPPADAGALAGAIDYMLDHYREYAPEKLAQYARDRYSYERVGQALNEVYRGVI